MFAFGSRELAVRMTIAELSAAERGDVYMDPIGTIERARKCLRDQFGAAWEAPYAPGKARMADWLADRLALPHEVAVRLVETMEREGMVRFAGATGRTASPSAQQKAGPAGQSPLTPDVVVPAATPPSPEVGTWFIA
jgi:hypothetical protein